MFIKQKFTIGLSDINSNLEVKNTIILKYLEDIANTHSELVGSGITDIKRTKKTWILLHWKVKMYRKPLINDTIEIKTASRKINKIYAFRDYEIYDTASNELIGIASSKWIYVDIENGKIEKIDEKLEEAYKQEKDFNVFNEDDIEKLKEPENKEYICDYKITKNMIDVNKHLHNIYYMDIAKEVLPEEISVEKELNEFEIYYKKEVKLGENVKVYLSKVDDEYYVVIKSSEDLLHAIIKLK